MEKIQKKNVLMNSFLAAAKSYIDFFFLPFVFQQDEESYRINEIFFRDEKSKIHSQQTFERINLKSNFLFEEKSYQKVENVVKFIETLQLVVNLSQFSHPQNQIFRNLVVLTTTNFSNPKASFRTNFFFKIF